MPGEPHDHRGRRPEEILDALRTLSARADVVLVSGGLGPTADDLTAEVAALAAGVPLVLHEGALAALRERFAVRGLTVTENNMKQVMVPAGSEVVLNPAGSAPMFVLRLGKAVLFFVPGVPREYRALVETGVLPRIDALGAERGETGFRALRLLKTVFLPESHLDARVRPLLALHPRVTFGFRTHFPENHLKLMAEGRTREEALEVLEAADAASRPLLGDHLFAVDDDTMAGVVGRAAGPAGDARAGRELHGGPHRGHADRRAGGERLLPRERGRLRQRAQGALGLGGAHHPRGERRRLAAGGGGDGAGRSAGGGEHLGPW